MVCCDVIKTMNTLQPTVFIYLIVVTGLVSQVFACLATSYDVDKRIAHCSDSKSCPPDANHCHLTNPRKNYGTCCLGCGRGALDPKRSCRKHAECNNNTTTKLYMCRKPEHNNKALGVCCELKGY